MSRSFTLYSFFNASSNFKCVLPSRLISSSVCLSLECAYNTERILRFLLRSNVQNTKKKIYSRLRICSWYEGFQDPSTASWCFVLCWTNFLSKITHSYVSRMILPLHRRHSGLGFLLLETSGSYKRTQKRCNVGLFSINYNSFSYKNKMFNSTISYTIGVQMANKSTLYQPLNTRSHTIVQFRYRLYVIGEHFQFCEEFLYIAPLLGDFIQPDG